MFFCGVFSRERRFDMKKTALCILVCALCTAALFADEIFTPSGELYWGSISYVGKNCGQKTYDEKVRDLNRDLKMRSVHEVYPNAKLPKGYMEAVNELLNRYDTSKGDTFLLDFFKSRDFITTYYCVCEFTDDTHYTLWVVSTR
jgi:hypothetical protein